MKFFYLSSLLGFLSFLSSYSIHASYYTLPQEEDLMKTYKINEELEINNLVRKIKIQRPLKIKNKSSQKIHIKFIFTKNSEKHLIIDSTLFDKNKFFFSPPEGWRLDDIKLSPPLYSGMEIKSLEESVKIIIQKKKVVHFPKPLGHFDFHPFLFKPSTDKNLLIFSDFKREIAPNLTDKFQEEFDNNLKFIVRILCPEEGIIPLNMFKHRAELYKQNRLEEVLFNQRYADNTVKYKIPQEFHKVWITNPSDPKELPENYINWAKESTVSNPPSEGWKFFLWVQKKSFLPLTLKKLEDTPIQVKEFGELASTLTEADILFKSIESKKFGLASDLLRALILKGRGGVYIDTDYIVKQSCAILNKRYDFYAGLEPMSSFIGNAFIAASPNHPIINTYLELIVRNFNERQAPQYIRNIPEKDGFKTILLTGPSVLSLAFYKSAGLKNNIDILFPPIMLYPTPVLSYPQKVVARPEDALPEVSLGVHFWETAWFRSEFGSKG